MGSQGLNELGTPKKWKSDAIKRKASRPHSVFTSKHKQAEIEMRTATLAADRRLDVETKLKRPFKSPSVVGRQNRSEPRRRQERTQSRSKAPKSEWMSEDREDRPRMCKSANFSDVSDEENGPRKQASPSYSSDEESDKRRARNDIPSTGWDKAKKAASKSKLKLGTKEWEESVRIKFSESASPEIEDMAGASEKSSKWSADKKEEEEPAKPKRRFFVPTLSQQDELEEEQKPAPKGFVKVELTASPERQTKNKKTFVKPEIEDEDEDEPEKEEQRNQSARRLKLLERAGADLKKAKRTLKDIGLGDGLDNIAGSSPKKAATLSLAARIAEARRSKEEKNIKEEQEDDDAEDLIELDDSLLDEDATCPMCHEHVPHSLLMAFSNNRPRSLNTRQQAAFCVHHKRDSALKSYKGLGYPSISWETFNNRIASHYGYIFSLITSPNTTPSHYRPLFASDIAHGRNRTIKQSIMGTTGLGSDTARVLIPGYYGPRGARAMQEAILLKFNRELRKAAVDDNVVSARAVGGYVASVLVPELGTRLIMEDLEIGEEEARGVMEKSAALGSLANEEVRDVRSEADRALEDGGGDYD